MFPASSSRGGNGGASVPPGDGHLLCSYPLHLCSREKFAGHDFCLRHILDDRSAPFKQCNYTFTKTQGNNPPRRCPRPAPKSDRKDGFCVEHSRKALMTRQKSNASRLAGIAVKRTASVALASSSAPPGGQTAKLMDDLAHYKAAKVEQPEAPLAAVKDEAGLPVHPPPNHEDNKPVKPDCLDIIARRIPGVNRRALDSSELDSDDDPQTVEAAWNGNDDNSDAESVDSELDNPLKHAGAYSAEEVVRIMREKLIRLQKLYVDQFQRLRYLLREEGRKYKHSVLAEKEAELSSIHSQLKTSLEDVLTYDKIKALNHYQRPQGLEAVLHHAFLERRAKLGEPSGASTSGNAGGSNTSSAPPSGQPGPASSAGGASSGGGYHFKPTVLPKCSYHVTSSTKCGEAVVPLSKFCLKHILEDSGQVLFRSCGHVAVNAVPGADNVETADPSDDGPCETPIAGVLEGATCVFHTQFQPPFSTRGPSTDKKPLKQSCDSQDSSWIGGTSTTAKSAEDSVKKELEQQHP